MGDRFRCVLHPSGFLLLVELLAQPLDTPRQLLDGGRGLLCVLMSLRLNVWMQNASRQVAKSLYLRNIRVFLADLGMQMAVSFSNVCVKSLTSWARLRITYAWQHQLQDSCQQ